MEENKKEKTDWNLVLHILSSIILTVLLTITITQEYYKEQINEQEEILYDYSGLVTKQEQQLIKCVEIATYYKEKAEQEENGMDNR